MSTTATEAFGNGAAAALIEKIFVVRRHDRIKVISGAPIVIAIVVVRFASDCFPRARLVLLIGAILAERRLKFEDRVHVVLRLCELDARERLLVWGGARFAHQFIALVTTALSGFVVTLPATHSVITFTAFELRFVITAGRAEHLATAPALLLADTACADNGFAPNAIGATGALLTMRFARLLLAALTLQSGFFTCTALIAECGSRRDSCRSGFCRRRCCLWRRRTLTLASRSSLLVKFVSFGITTATRAAVSARLQELALHARSRPPKYKTAPSACGQLTAAMR